MKSALQGWEGTRPPGDGRAKGGRRPRPASWTQPSPPPGRTTTPRTGGQQGSAGQPLALGVGEQRLLHGRPAGLGSPQATQRGAREGTHNQGGTGRPLLSPERPPPLPGSPAWPRWGWGQQDKLQTPAQLTILQAPPPPPGTASPLSPRPPCFCSSRGRVTPPCH